MKKCKYMVDVITYLPIVIVIEVEASNAKQAKEKAKKLPPKVIVEACLDELKDPTNLEHLYYADRSILVLGKSKNF